LPHSLASHSAAKFLQDLPQPALGGLPGAGEWQIPGFPSKNARSKNRRKFLRRNGQRGYSGISPEY
jgi:hypothetical protein